jgi:oxalate---CoA ligase
MFDGSAGAPALISASGMVMTYAALAEQVSSISRWLTGFIAPQQVVAVIAGNSPAAVSAILGVADACVCAPLPSGASVAERVAQLRRVGASMVLAPAGSADDSLAASQVGIPLVHLPGATPPVRGPHCSVPGTALLVLTSGSTGAGKLVPILRSALSHAASLVAGTLGLTAADRCLNPLPLHHTHGLVGAVLSSLSVGGSVICLSEYTDAEMTDAIDRLDPTWYTAVPAIHARVAAFAAAGQLTGHRLRFARSASAPLNPQLQVRLASALGVPVVQAYALTEAPGQVTAQGPADPVTPGSVGLPAGCEVAIVSEEIYVRGPHVAPGYLSSVDAPVDAHPDGWLRTGDLGRLSASGDLILTGRRDDVINRAGEKIFPEEIETAIAAHPDVMDVVVAGVPDAALGEAVLAVVVGSVTHSELRSALTRVPDRIVTMSLIPRSATGKVNRRELAARFVDGASAGSPDLVEAMAKVWSEVLFLPSVDPDTGLAELGGESLHGARIEALVAERFGVQLPAAVVLDRTTTVRAMAALIAQARQLSV